MPNAEYSIKINKAFVIQPNDFQYFYSEGKRFMELNTCGSFETIVIGIPKNIDEILIRSKPDSIIGYSNPKRYEITGIAISIKSDDEEHSFKLTFDNSPYEPPAYLNIGGKSLEEVESYSRKLEAELLERTQWYSFISNRVWFVKYRLLLLFVFIFLVVLGLASTFIRLHELNRKKADVERIISEYSNVVSNANEEELIEKAQEALKSIDQAKSPITLIKWIFIWIAAFFIGKFIERFIHYLFPRVVFEIGAGKKRHETIKRVRKHVGYWMMTLIVGIVLLIVGLRLSRK